MREALLLDRFAVDDDAPVRIRPVAQGVDQPGRRGEAKAAIAGGEGCIRDHFGLVRRQSISLFDRLAKRRDRSEEHTSELQSLMRISYAVFCLKKKKNTY